MYRQIQPLHRIDEHVTNRHTQLYEPLRRSLLRKNLSQSNISSRSNLSNSRVNDLSSSRVSRRMRSLSPQECEQIKSNTFIPITKRLVPTKNLQMVKNKKFEAIDVQERIYRPISAIRFNSINRFNVNKVEEIVYQTEDQINASHYQGSYQLQPLQQRYDAGVRKVPPMPQQNIYTNRNNNLTPNYAVGASQVRQYSPRQGYGMGLDSRQMLDTFGGRNYVPPAPPQQNYTTYENHYVNTVPNNPLASTGSFQKANNNLTSFQNSPAFNPSTLPLITSTGIQYENAQPFQTNSPRFFQNNAPQSPNNLYTSQCVPQIRQLPTQHTLSFLASPLGSWTSFEPQNPKPQSQLSRSYDFSKLSQDSTSSEYKQKKTEEWKYNLFSVFDEPVNTKCSKTGCFKNQIIASRPNLYEWQQ